eukprot:scaffold1945_cov181-Ochromonas_danica.AAC.15
MLFGKEINHWYDIPIDDLILGIPRESVAEENRVSQTPETVAELVKLGFQVVVEKGAGENAQYHDEAYEQAGAVIVSQRQVWKADIVVRQTTLPCTTLLYLCNTTSLTILLLCWLTLPCFTSFTTTL